MAIVSTTRLAAFLIAAVASGACGGDEGGGGGGGADKAKAEAAAKKKKKEEDKKKKKAKREEPVSYISSLEVVLKPYIDKDGNPLVKRPRLTSNDFMATENRDPFRSFVMPQLAEEDTGGNTPAGPTGPVTQPTALCAKLQLIASTFSVDDLDLIGIVKRGTKRYAMFRDSRGVGHLVDKGKCIGREKGKVVEIGDSLVCYEVTPEQPADATAVTVVTKKCIALYPNEITDAGDEEFDLSARPDVLAPTEPSPTSSPPPTTTPGPPPAAPQGGPP